MLEAAAPAAMATHNPSRGSIPRRGVLHAGDGAASRRRRRRRPGRSTPTRQTGGAASFVVVVAGAALRTFRAARASGDAAAVAARRRRRWRRVRLRSRRGRCTTTACACSREVATHDLLDAFGAETFESWSGSKPSPLASTTRALRGKRGDDSSRVACGPVFTQSIDVAPRRAPRRRARHRRDDAGRRRFEGAPASALERVEKFLRISRDEMRAEQTPSIGGCGTTPCARDDCAGTVAGVAAGIAERDGKGERDRLDCGPRRVTGGASHLQKKVDVAGGRGRRRGRRGRRLLRAFGVGGAGGGDGGGRTPNAAPSPPTRRPNAPRV